MSLKLTNVILHQLKKDNDENLTVNLREQLLNHSTSTEQFISELHDVYNAKHSKGFGTFSQDSDVANWLKACRAGEINFQSFSTQAAERLREELSKYPFASDGLLVFAEYHHLATEYLFIALIETQNSVQVTEDLEISETDYLDLSKMDIAACIDLSTWETDSDSNRYLTYIKGRVGRRVADFFLDFMQADIGLDSKKQNTLMVQALEDFCEQSQLEKADKEMCRKQVQAYCSTQAKAGEEVIVKDLSEELPTNEAGQNFYQFVAEQGYEMEDSFPADATMMRKLTKFVGSGGGLTVNFDSLLLGERIFYDENTDTLTIKGTPPNLREQLKRRLNSDNE